MMLLKTTKKTKSILTHSRAFYAKDTFKLEDLGDLFEENQINQKEETNNTNEEETIEAKPGDEIDLNEEDVEEQVEINEEEFYSDFYPKDEKIQNLMKDEDDSVENLLTKLSKEQHEEEEEDKGPKSYQQIYKEKTEKTLESLAKANSVLYAKPYSTPLSKLKESTRSVHIFDHFYQGEMMNKERKERIQGNKTVDLLADIVAASPPVYRFARSVEDVGVSIIIKRNILRHFSGVKYFRRGKSPHMILPSTMKGAFDDKFFFVDETDPEGSNNNKYFKEESAADGIELLEYQREMDGVENALDQQSHNPMTYMQKQRRRKRRNLRRMFHKRLEGTLQVIMHMRKHKKNV